jgi:hypothetical protein
MMKENISGIYFIGGGTWNTIANNNIISTKGSQAHLNQPETNEPEPVPPTC